MSDEQHHKGEVIAGELERLHKGAGRLSVLVTIVSFVLAALALALLVVGAARIGKVEDFHHS
jgi:hypothetical protein